MVNYEEYLKSDSWKTKSTRFRETVGFCEKCGNDKNLTCHHHTYKNLGKETREDIVVLCWRCHRKQHKKDVDRKEDNGKLWEERKIIPRTPTKKNPRKYKGLSPKEARLVGLRLKRTNSMPKFRR